MKYLSQSLKNDKKMIKIAILKVIIFIVTVIVCVRNIYYLYKYILAA